MWAQGEWSESPGSGLSPAADWLRRPGQNSARLCLSCTRSEDGGGQAPPAPGVRFCSAHWLNFPVQRADSGNMGLSGESRVVGTHSSPGPPLRRALSWVLAGGGAEVTKTPASSSRRRPGVCLLGGVASAASVGSVLGPGWAPSDPCHPATFRSPRKGARVPRALCTVAEVLLGRESRACTPGHAVASPVTLRTGPRGPGSRYFQTWCTALGSTSLCATGCASSKVDPSRATGSISVPSTLTRTHPRHRRDPVLRQVARSVSSAGHAVSTHTQSTLPGGRCWARSPEQAAWRLVPGAISGMEGEGPAFPGRLSGLHRERTRLTALPSLLPSRPGA